MNDDDGHSPCARCCPYGPFLLVVSALTTAGAMLLTWIAAFACSFYEADNVGIGLWTVQDPFSMILGGDDCTGWNSATFMKELLDPPMVFARVMSLIACLSSPLVFVVILLPSCMTMPRTFIKGLVVFMFFLSFSVMLCLVALASDICSNADDCSIDAAGIMCIVASILWAISGCTTLALQKRSAPPAPIFRETAAIPATATATPAGTPGEVLTKVLSPDGTLTTTRTTTIANPDGSKTVSETTEVTPAECR